MAPPSLKLGCFLAALGGLVDERLVNVGNDTSSSNGGFDKGIKLFVSSNR